MFNRIIALSGWRGSGKDTVAEYLVEQYGYIRKSFAERLKDLVSSQYGISRGSLDDRQLKEMPLVQYPVISTDPFTSTMHQLLDMEFREGYWTPRALCILEGSVKRSVHSNYWLRSIVGEITDGPVGQNYVISDVRYRSEMDTLRLLLGPDAVTSIRINRYEFIDTNDSSERDLDNYRFDYVISNTGSKEELYAEIDSTITGSTQLLRATSK